MKAPSTAAVRSLGKLVERYRHCGAVSAPVVYPVNCVGPSRNFGVGKGLGLLRDEVRLMQRTFPNSWGRQVQPERGFLGIGDGDEELGLSKHFEQNRVIGYSPEQVFDVVAAVDLYEDFVPWCQKSRVLWRTDDKMDAELEVGFKLFVERYISHVQLKPPNVIKTSVSQSSLFDFLNNEWHFKPGPTADSCHLFFVVDFRFKSPLYRRVANLFFNEVQAQLVGSFEERCQAVYGPSMETIMRVFLDWEVLLYTNSREMSRTTMRFDGNLLDAGLAASRLFYSLCQLTVLPNFDFCCLDIPRSNPKME